MSNESKPLTAKQIAFCQEYIADLNGAASARRAGYESASAKEQASDLLTKPNIRNYIDTLIEQRSKRLMISSDAVLAELYDLLRVNITDFYDEVGELLPPHLWTKEKAKAVAQYDVTNNGTKIKLVDKHKTIEQLAKHLQIFTENTVVINPPPTELTEEGKDLLRRLLKRD